MEDVMQPGPEMDAKVSALMGVEPTVEWLAMNEDETAYCLAFTYGGRREGEEWFASLRDGDVRKRRYHLASIKRYPRYSTDSACAMEVLEKLRENPWDTITLRYDAGEWAMSLHEDAGRSVEGPPCPSLPHAICLAALVTKGEEGR
jgi:hypothetical protein